MAEPIEFKGHNVVFGANQKEYTPLPALRTPDGTVYTCWKFTEEELEEIKRTGTVYVSLMTFNAPLQPIMIAPTLDSFFDLKEG